MASYYSESCRKQANVTGSFSHISQSVRCLEEPMTREISQFPGVHYYSAIVLGGQAMPTCWGRAGAPFVWVLRIVCTYSLWTPSLCIWDQPPLWNDLLPDVGTHLCLQLLKKMTVHLKLYCLTVKIRIHVTFKSRIFSQKLKNK